MIGILLKYVAIFFTILGSFLLGVCTTLGSCSAELLPTVLAADTAQAVQQVKLDSADVFGEIQANIDLVASLRAKVQAAQLNAESVSLDEVISDIERVTLSYENLASQRDEVRSALLGKVAIVEGMRRAVDAEIESLRAKRAGYTEQKRLVSDPDAEIARTRREALTRAIAYVDAQIELWREFGAVEQDISLEMTDIQRTIDSFLSMIESTAIVFREGLNLLVLQRDLNEAVALFSSDLPNMGRLTTDMESSWDNLDYLLNTLTGVANFGAK